MLKIIIAGSRSFDDYDFLKKQCDLILAKFISKEVEIVSGTAKGADYLGECYAIHNGYNIKKYPANWQEYGKRAGHVRNKQMAEYADVLIAFWDGISRGTQDMVEQMNKLNKKVFIPIIRKEKK
jgi:hypothetical protein